MAEPSGRNTKKDETVNVVVVDDHEVVREGLLRILERHGGIKVVSVAKSGEEALQRIKKFTPHVAIIDVMLPDMNGIELAKRIRDESGDVAVLMLTVYDDPAFVRRAIEAGALGYIIKDVAQDELVQAVKAARKGEMMLSEQVAEKMSSTEPVKTSQGKGDLSQRELDVLRLLATGSSNKEIADKLFISELTVKVHIRNIFRKIGVGDRTKAVLYAIQNELVEK